MTSRPVTPVPPVAMTTSTLGSAIQALSRAVMAAVSSLTMRAIDHPVAVASDQLDQGAAGLVVGFGAGIGNGQDGDIDRLERQRLVNSPHWRPALLLAMDRPSWP